MIAVDWGTSSLRAYRLDAAGRIRGQREEACGIMMIADGAGIAGGMQPVRWGKERSAWIAPGLSCRSSAGVPDVMRGEETQIIGALAELSSGEATICLPG